MKDFEAGKPVVEIAEKFRISRQRVHIILKRLKKA
jgi:Mor family transcriptional regulator